MRVYTNKILIIASSGLIFLLSFCSHSNEDPLKKENDRIQNELNGYMAKFYGAAKTALRSGGDTSDPEITKARTEFLAFFQNLIAMQQDSKSDTTKNFGNILSIYDAVNCLVKKDEDNFPTLLEMLTGAMRNPVLSEGLGYDKNTEHGMLGTLWCISVKGPRIFALYEFNKTNTAKIQDKVLVLPVQLAMGLTYTETDYPFHAINYCSEYIAGLEAGQKVISTWLVT